MILSKMIKKANSKIRKACLPIINKNSDKTLSRAANRQTLHIKTIPNTKRKIVSSREKKATNITNKEIRKIKMIKSGKKTFIRETAKEYTMINLLELNHKRNTRNLIKETAIDIRQIKKKKYTKNTLKKMTSNFKSTETIVRKTQRKKVILNSRSQDS
jgi:hypothetical protein